MQEITVSEGCKIDTDAGKKRGMKEDSRMM